MAEILRSADPETIETAVRRMAANVQGLGGLVEQLQASIDSGERVGGVLPVSIFLGAQVAGRSILNELRGALDSLTVGGKRFDIEVELAKTARGGTDIDS